MRRTACRVRERELVRRRDGDVKRDVWDTWTDKKCVHLPLSRLPRGGPSRKNEPADLLAACRRQADHDAHLSSLASTHHARRLASLALSQWRTRLSHLSRLSHAADARAQALSARRAVSSLVTWRLSTRLSLLARARSHALADSALAAWSAAYEHVEVELAGRADALVARKGAQLRAVTFGAWHEAAQQRARLEVAARGVDRASVLRRVVGRWKGREEAQRVQARRANVVRDFMQVRGAWRTWCEKAWDGRRARWEDERKSARKKEAFDCASLSLALSCTLRLTTLSLTLSASQFGSHKLGRRCETSSSSLKCRSGRLRCARLSLLVEPMHAPSLTLELPCPTAHPLNGARGVEGARHRPQVARARRERLLRAQGRLVRPLSLPSLLACRAIPDDLSTQLDLQALGRAGVPRRRSPRPRRRAPRRQARGCVRIFLSTVPPVLLGLTLRTSLQSCATASSTHGSSRPAARRLCKSASRASSPRATSASRSTPTTRGAPEHSKGGSARRCCAGKRGSGRRPGSTGRGGPRCVPPLSLPVKAAELTLSPRADPRRHAALQPRLGAASARGLARVDDAVRARPAGRRDGPWRHHQCVALVPRRSCLGTTSMLTLM